MLKKALKYLLLIAVLIVAVSWFFANNSKPNYKGEISIEGLQEEVTIYFDEYGIPHIYAQNQFDAYMVLGYVHAQDRLWQMELMRRISAGRLSEVFGKKMIETDKLFLGLGI